ncbi:MAG: putative phospholipid/glycerol acyltransferase [Bacteriovoracaceae bacterium]|nr:putative phospholipid/glycerol acyltransferase [Bacteriovoracaceae bacterium]
MPLKKMIEHLLQLSALNKIYHTARTSSSQPHFFDRTLDAMRITLDFNRDALPFIPKTGPLVVVANHASGGVDGIALGSLLMSVRPDVKIVANDFLGKIPEFHDSMIFVDPFESASATHSNLSALRKMFSWLESGGVLVIFPAGEVSKMDLKENRITDPKWKLTLARLVRKSGASVLPIFFHDKTSSLFQMTKLVAPMHPVLEKLPLSVIPHELLRRRGLPLRFTVGKILTHEKLKPIPTDEELVAYLRARTYLLANSAASRKFCTLKNKELAEVSMEAIAPELSSSIISDEIKNLPPENMLCNTTEYQVFIAGSKQIPNCLYEIGRLREFTFRTVGEGSGAALDLDRYDKDYLHIFAWNKIKLKIVGAYRLGRIDKILEKSGKSGLYTASLFKYGPQVVENLGAALELGRAFVIPEEQGGHTLSLMWQGIGHWISQNPEYSRLIGSVSISDEFETISKQLMLQFFKRTKLDSALSKQIQPKVKPRFNALNSGELEEVLKGITNFDDLSEVVSQLEQDGKKAPELFEHYAKFNAQFLGFNIDRSFRDAIDCLIMIDLKHADQRLLRRFIGRDGLLKFQNFHSGK